MEITRPHSGYRLGEQIGFLFNEDGYYFSDKIVQSNIATEPILGSRSLC